MRRVYRWGTVGIAVLVSLPLWACGVDDGDVAVNADGGADIVLEQGDPDPSDDDLEIPSDPLDGPADLTDGVPEVPLDVSDTSDGTEAPTELCPVLPAPVEPIVHVDPTQTGQLRQIVSGAAEGTTIVLAAGHYDLHGEYLWFATPGVTLRGATGNREDVVLDGNWETTEIVSIAASNVTIAEVTLQNAINHPIHVMSGDGADTTGTLIYRVHVRNPGQQGIKINPIAGSGNYVDDGEVACSIIELTDAERHRIWDINGQCYTGGVDGHQARGWRIRDNRIEGFWCDEGLSEHAVHFWTGSRGTLVERNQLVNNARGVGFGLGSSGTQREYEDAPCPDATYIGHYEGVIRNNGIVVDRAELFSSEAGFDCGVCLEQACETRVFHNSVVSTTAPRSSSIEWRFSNTQVTVANNAVTSRLVARDGASAELSGNLEEAPLTLWVDVGGGDVHLRESATQAIDQGVVLPAGACDDDLDGQVRGPAPDIGADEWIPAS